MIPAAAAIPISPMGESPFFMIFLEPKYAEAMLIAYNAKNKYRLPIKKLYGSQRDEELDDEETDDETAAI